MNKPVSRTVVDQIAHDLARERNTAEILRARVRILEAALWDSGVDPREVLPDAR